MFRPGTAFTALMLCATFVADAGAVDIRSVRVVSGPEGTRVVMDLSGRAEHTLFSLTDPQRVVIDVAAARLKASKPEPGGVVKEVRFGNRDDGSVRIVLDVGRAVKASSALVAPAGKLGHRLVVDLGGGAVAEPTPIRAAHAPTGRRDLVIAIDAGHGGVDPGAIGRAGNREKDIALAISRLLAKRIDREEGMRAVLIRDGDYFLSLRARRDKARQHQADLFVSVHADAMHDRSISGSSVYILSTGRASNEAARMLAERENAADLVGGISLADKNDVLASALVNLSKDATLRASLTAAQKVLRELDRIGEVRKPQIQQASLAVLTSPDVPSMLVETAYISNAADEKRLKSPAHQQKLANAIHAGITAYFQDNAPPGTLFAHRRANKRMASGAD